VALVPFPGAHPSVGAFESDIEEDAAGAKMSFLEHLDELRTRIVHSLVAIAVGVLVGFAFINYVIDFILGPSRRLLPAGSKMIYTQPGEAFSLWIQVAMIIGVIVAAPYVMYQVWLFIAPGLYTNEKKFAIPFVFLSTAGFIGGAAFNHYIVFPWMMAFFASYNTPELAFMPRLEDVFDLYTKMLLGMGVVFQMPTIVYFLAKMKLVTARFLVRNIKYAVLIIFIVAAVITPSGDMVTQTIFAAPMVGLYLLSILIAWIVGPKRVKAATGAGEIG
jgi:sec-independent protein translocase protein TatC